MAKLRLGIADLLDSRPLAWGFLKGHFSDFFATFQHRPARVAELLTSADLDAGLVPAVDLARLSNVRVVPDVGVSAPGTSSAVVLLHRCPLNEVKTVSVDGHSRAGRLLAQAVLQEKHDLTVSFEELPQVSPPVSGDTAAVLMLAENALKASWEGCHATSLTHQWRELFDVPFVLAVWVVRDDVQLPDLNFYFKSSLRYGLSSMDALVREAGTELEVRINRVHDYLENQLRFVLAEEADDGGLVRQFERLQTLGLVEEVPEVRYL